MAKVGGRGKIVVINETYFTRKKRNAGGFCGRQTHGHKVIVLGIVELDLVIRKETGQFFLIEIPDVKKQTMIRQITKFVKMGSLVFTDKHKSNRWLGTMGFVHRVVNHKRREFSCEEVVYGERIPISPIQTKVCLDG